MKLSRVTIWENAQNFKLNLLLVPVLVLKSKALYLFYKKYMEVGRENLCLDIGA